MRNQPKYNFFKNTSYALNGFKDIIQTESSFKIELSIACILLPILAFVDISITEKLFLFISLMGVLIAEVINSSIERAVDLVTLEQHDMAKRAKDVGSTVVFLSITTCSVVWLVVIANNIF